MTQRQCGDCLLCCKVLAVAALDKPANRWCLHANLGAHRCDIYEDRPEECRAFDCLWLKHDEHTVPEPEQFVVVLPETCRPDKINVMFTDGDRLSGFPAERAFEAGAIQAYESHAGAWMGARGIINWLLSAGVPVLVVSERKSNLIEPKVKRVAVRRKEPE